MTDITDQELRDAIEWGRRNEYSGDPAEANAAIVILATVDAPAPTLAERLREQFYDPEPTDEQYGIILDAEQMEHDSAEARAERDRLEADRDAYERMYIESRAEATALAEDLAGAESEVERLAAERDRLEAAQYLSDGSAWGGPVREPTVQKGAESNAESTDHDKFFREEADNWIHTSDNPVMDPADVKPGEAWIVECRGERRTAVKGRADDLPWSTIDANGRHVYKRNKNVTLITRLVPAPRVITNPDELDTLAEGAVIVSASKIARVRQGWFWPGTNGEHRVISAGVGLPVTVLWEPEA